MADSRSNSLGEASQLSALGDRAIYNHNVGRIDTIDSDWHSSISICDTRNHCEFVVGR
jgi:hypothetical protein